MRKKLAAAALSASLLVGGAAGATVLIPSVASAATSASSAVAPQWVTDALNGLVGKGTIDQAQADAVAQALADARPADAGGHHGGPGHSLSAAATALGISEADLRTALESGQTIAQVASDKGVDVQVVIDALVAEANTHIDSEVASGELTQAEADARKADVVQRVTDMVNNVRPAGGPGGHGHGPGTDDPAESTTTTTG
jgi:hypothetical protein